MYNASGRFTKLDSQRQQHLNRARKCAELTIPYLLPPQGADDNTPLPTPYQGLGARAVNNLAAKLLLTILPPNAPFFKMDIEPRVLRELQEAIGEEGVKTKILSNLGVYEKDVISYIESQHFRDPINLILLLLVITGNALGYVPKGSTSKVYKLDQYVVKRSPKGEVLEVIIKEGISKESAPKELLDDNNKDEEIDLYTIIVKKDGKYNIHQEINNKLVPDSEGSYSKESCPWLVLTWNRGVGDNYGRGHVETYLGDFISLESLSKSITEGAAVAAKTLFLVNPNGTTNKRDLIKTPNAGFAPGNSEDVHVLQVEKYHDFRIAYETVAKIEERIAHAFLLHSSVQRNAERVTAEEVRYMAQELEDALGGIYSLLSQEFQLPFVKLIISQMRSSGKLPALPKEIKPIITTGLEALGRGHDLNKLNAFAQQLQLLGPETMAKYMRVDNYIARIGTALGIDTEELVKSQEEIMQEEQQQQQMAMMSQMMSSGAATQVAKGMVEGQVSPEEQGE